jgi:hypothetical protein
MLPAELYEHGMAALDGNGMAALDGDGDEALVTTRSAAS